MSYSYQDRAPMMQKAQQGFSLVEVLVAIVILALGLLGFAALQVTGLRYASNAATRFAVSSQANDIMDRIRANMAGFRAGSYFGSAGTAGSCISTTCTSAQMAAADLADWNAQNARLLPGGSGTVTDATNGTATVTLSWTQRNAAGSAFTTKTYSINFVP